MTLFLSHVQKWLITGLPLLYCCSCDTLAFSSRFQLTTYSAQLYTRYMEMLINSQRTGQESCTADDDDDNNSKTVRETTCYGFFLWTWSATY